MVKDSAAACLVLLAAMACGGGDGWTGTVTDSAGITVVHNAERGSWGSGEAWTVTESLRIGTAEGDPDYQFGQIPAVAVSANGDIYVLDQLGSEIKQFDATGNFVRRFAGAGSGPGQLGPNAASMAIVRDTLFVLDQGNSRVNRYQLDGTAVGSFRVDPTAGILLRLEASPRRTLVAQTRRFAFPGVAPDSMDRVVELASDGTPVDTLFSFPSGSTFSAAGGRPQLRLFSAEPIWDLRANGDLLFAINDTYRVQVRDTAGNPTRILTRPYTATPVTEDDADRLRDAILRAMARSFPQQPSTAQMEQMRQIIQFADYYPAFATLTAGPRNSIWVQQLQSPSAALAGDPEALDIATVLFAPRWDVFDAEGRFLGTIEMPGNTRVITFEDDALYGVLTDDLGVEYVVRLEVASD